MVAEYERDREPSPVDQAGAGLPSFWSRARWVRLFAAFNIADGTVISELHRRHRAAARA